MMLRRLTDRMRHLLSPRGTPSKPRKRRTRLGIEALEERAVPTVVFDPHFGQQTRGDPARTSGFSVLSNSPVYLIFWGTDWGTTTGQQQAATLTNDARAILNSTYLNGLTEYGSDGHAHLQASWVDTHNEPPSGFTSTDVQNEISHAIFDPTSPIFGPGSSTSITTSPIYVVVTDPNHSAGNGGYNQAGTFLGHPINMILVGTSTGSMEYAFGLTFSHEMAERMSDPTGNTLGVTVRPPSGIPSNLNGGLSQIGDNEPEPGGQPHYSYRLNGQVVQPYWSFQKGAYIVPDGNTQSFNLDAIWSIDSAGVAHFSNTYDLVINGDQLANKNDNIIIDTTAAGGVQITLNGEVATFDPGQIHSIQINTGTGTNSVSVRSTLPGVNVSILSGLNSNDTVTVGKNGSLSGIAGNVSVNSSGHTALVVDDSADTVARHGVLTNNSISGLSAGTISYTAPSSATGSGVTSVAVDGGHAANTFDIRSTAAFSMASYFGATGSNDTITVGNNGSLAGIAGNVNVNSSGHASLVIDDSSDSVGRHDVVNNDSVTLLSQGGTVIRYGAPTSATGGGVTSLTLKTGTGSNEVDVQSTAAFTPLSVVGLGSDTVYVGLNGSLSGVAGAVNVSNNSGHTSLQLDDSNDSVGRTVNITDHSVTGLSAGAINYTARTSNAGAGVSALTIDGGRAANTFNVQSTAAFAPLTIYGGSASNDTVRVGNAGSLSGIAGAVNVVNNSGHTALVIDDSADNVGRTATITNNSVTGLSAGAINYTAAGSATGNGVNAVTIDGGHGANTFNVLSTAQFAPLSIVGGVSSNDVVRIGNNGSLAGIAGAVNVSNASGKTNLIVDDHNDTVFHGNVRLTDHSVTGLSQGAINYTAGSGGNGVTQMSVFGSHGGDHIEVQSLSPNTNPVNLHLGKPTDVVQLDGLFSNLHLFSS
jgi:hypothetical protein